ncbi:MAG: glycoside hydrolase family 9 protein [Actinobacteria bacterium]|nr:glycoside hydrolase family 9 protein [Actinomycetota bacterium]MBL7123981.1 glycoside hydrolase family 9 protein [Actinomycetota bacterium]
MELPPTPPGVIAGGPNQDASDEGVSYFVDKVGPAKRYADVAKSFSTNEVAINWNAPLVWVTAFMDEKNNPEAGVHIVRAGVEKKNVVFYVIIVLAAAVPLLIVGLFVGLLVRKRKSTGKKK